MPSNVVAVWPIVTYAAVVLLVVGGMLAGSWLLGERHRAVQKDIPYESGAVPAGTARIRYGAHYYLVGVFFILFDIEAVIVFAWAVAFRELGWFGFISVSLFIVTLFLGLAYVWAERGLDWNPPPVRRNRE